MHKQMDFSAYQTFIFDCDGVILDSNRIKDDAFYEVALPYGKEMAEKLLDYHQRTMGVSRFEKMIYLHKTLLGKSDCEQDIAQSIELFGELSEQKVMDAPITAGLLPFLAKLPAQARKIVVSGSSQDELQRVFEYKKIAHWFDEIFGSPDSKHTILEREKKNGLLNHPSVFFGDGQLDYQVAMDYKMDFVYISGYTTQHSATFFSTIDNIYKAESLESL